MIHQKTRKTRALHLSPFEPVARRSGSHIHHWARADWAGRDPRSVPPFETKHRTMPPARHAAAGEAFALSEAAKGCRSGGGGGLLSWWRQRRSILLFWRPASIFRSTAAIDAKTIDPFGRRQLASMLQAEVDRYQYFFSVKNITLCRLYCCAHPQ